MKKKIKVTDNQKLKESIKESADKLRGVENFIPPLVVGDNLLFEPPKDDFSFLDIAGPMGLAAGFVSLGIAIGLMR